MEVFSDIQNQIISYLKTSGLKDSNTITDIANNLGKSKSVISNNLSSLTKKGIVEKRVISPRNIRFEIASNASIQEYINKVSSELVQNLLEIPNKQKKVGKLKLVFMGWYQLSDEQNRILEQKYNVVTYKDSPLYIGEDLFKYRAQDADIIVLFDMIKINEGMLKACPKLKAIVFGTISDSHLDKDIAKSLGIKVFTLDRQKNYKRFARREFIFVALFSLLRPVYRAMEELKVGEFEHRTYESEELAGKSVGLVGVKSEVTFVLDNLKGFGAHVLVANPDSPNTTAESLGVERFYSLDELFSKCDIVIFPEEYEKKIVIDNYLTSDSRVKYLLLLSYKVEYSLDLMRELIVSEQLKGLYIDYFPDVLFVFEDFANSEFKKIYNFPSVHITPELGFYTKESMKANKSQLLELLLNLEVE